MIKEERHRALKRERLTEATPNWNFVFVAAGDVRDGMRARKIGLELVAICERNDDVWQKHKFSSIVRMWMALKVLFVVNGIGRPSQVGASDESVIVIINDKKCGLFAVPIDRRYSLTSLQMLWSIRETRFLNRSSKLMLAGRSMTCYLLFIHNKMEKHPKLNVIQVVMVSLALQNIDLTEAHIPWARLQLIDSLIILHCFLTEWKYSFICSLTFFRSSTNSSFILTFRLSHPMPSSVHFIRDFKTTKASFSFK